MIDADGPELLVLVDVTWALWGPLVSEQKEGTPPWRRFDAFVHGLFGVPPSGGTDARSLDGRLLHSPDRDALGEYRDTRPDDDRHGVRDTREAAGTILDADRPTWQTGTDGGERLARMVQALRTANDLADHPDDDRGDLTLQPLLNAQACRIYLDGDRVHRLTGGGYAGPPVHTCLDLRFRRHMGQYWIVAALSLWTRHPVSRDHAPEPDPRAGPDPRIDPAAAQGIFDAVSDRFRTRLRDAFEPLRPVVYDRRDTPPRRYFPPRFWITGGELLDRTWPPSRSEVVDDLCRLVLGCPDARSTAVAQGIVHGVDGLPLWVLRRFVPEPGAPTYLVLFDSSAGPPAEQELAVQRFVYRTTDIEADAAVNLYDISTDANVNQALIDSYHSVAEIGAGLWDELSMSFPTARRLELNRLHEQAELLHQVLLQGIADLERVRTETDALQERVSAIATRIDERFDTTFTERPVPGRTGIRAAVRAAEYLEQTAGFVERTRESANRAQQTYQGVLNGVTCAFDERRVRSTDKVGVLALIVASAFAVLPIGTELLGALLDPPQPVAPIVGYGGQLRLMTGIGLVIVGLLVVGIWYALRRLGMLRTSRAFRRRYDRLRDYLVRCRTDRLSVRVHAERRKIPQHDDGIRDGWSDYHRTWDAIDAELSTSCAEQLDGIAALKADRVDRLPDRPWHRPWFPWGPRRRQRTHLKRTIEQWALGSLFITERPRRFHRYPLPRLMLLYRTYPAWSLVPGYETTACPPLVADADLLLGLRLQCRAFPQEIGVVQGWTALETRRGERDRVPAADVLTRICGVGAPAPGEPRIRAGMTRSDWQRVLEAMRTAPPAGAPAQGASARASRSPDR